MCGITGVLSFDQEKLVDGHRLKRMTDVIQHRGPDGEGFFVDKNIGLGHRRLSIIDLSTGDQPMYSENNQIVLVFNGEIYNYIELREELEKKGHKFRTDSDTEVIIKSYEAWGHDCQNKFNGMWSFALWDNTKKELFLSKDRIGEKPLHYTTFENTFIFGSELKSLFSYGVPKNPDLSLLEIYLTLTNIPEPYTFYKNVYKLKAGHYLVVKNGKVNEYKYWDMPEIDEANMLTNENSIYEQFETLFTDAVKIRMRADVPYGAFLSGGLDSSAVVATMSGISKFPVNTFTIGFPEREFDESKLALDVSKKFNTSHHINTVNPDDFNEIVNRVAFHYDEPFGDSSAIPTGYVSKFASEKVKMVLTGDGGDEVLSGYNSYAGIKIAQIYQKFPELIQKTAPRIASSFAKLLRGNLRLKLNQVENILHTSSIPFTERMIQKRTYTDFSMIKNLVKNIPDIHPVEDYFSDIMKKCTYKDEFYKLMYMNFKIDLPNDYLVKVDRMSMAHSLETRVPFLDYRLIEFMATVDKKVKLQGWERKSVLRNSVGKKLPESILNAPKKGFGIPLREWFKADSFEATIDSNLDKVTGVLDKNIVDKIINNNKQGIEDNGNFIWTMMLLNKNI